MALVISFVIGLFWINHRFNSVRRGQSGWLGELAKTGVFGLLTYLGPLALARWHVNDAGPELGFFWALGILFSIIFVYHRLLDSLSGVAADLPRPQRKVVRKYVAASLMRIPVEEIEKGAEHRAREQRKRLLEANADAQLRFNMAVERLHDYIHSARDQATYFIQQYRRAVEELAEHQKIEVFSTTVRELQRQYLRAVLSDLLHVFQAITGGKADVWIAIRAAEGEGQNRRYSTLIREPAAYDSRDDLSVPIPEAEGVVKYLRERMDQGKPILRFDQNVNSKGKCKRNKGQWLQCPNDKRRDDQSSLIAPVCRRVSEGNGGKREVAMILFVNSPKETAFTDEATPFLKCCSDVLSIVFFSTLPRIKVRPMGGN